jgi:hypothetical protein
MAIFIIFIIFIGMIKNLVGKFGAVFELFYIIFLEKINSVLEWIFSKQIAREHNVHELELFFAQCKFFLSHQISQLQKRLIQIKIVAKR